VISPTEIVTDAAPQLVVITAMVLAALVIRMWRGFRHLHNLYLRHRAQAAIQGGRGDR
jgi:hypothetical protein